MEKLIGRADEKEMLRKALGSPEAELIAVYGRRRVGKTFLIRSVFEKQLLFELSGIHEAKLQEQLQNFSFALKNAMGSTVDLAVPANWISAFQSLQNFLGPVIKKQKGVIFFDEFPWIHSQKSNFLPAFEHFWNSWASKQHNLKVVICGSAASWMIQNIVNNKGGLHNRVSQRIRLMPFTLHETGAYLKSRSVKLERYQILQLYMAMGGIPQYLKGINPGESAAQAIDRMCFAKNGILKDEFDNLYSSLFDNPAHHISVIKALAAKSKGLTRNEIIDKCGLSSGGTATKILGELKESGFITLYSPFDKNVKEGIYKLCDEYSLFYLKFMGNPSSQAGAWLRLSEQASWKSWSGFVFETICLKHSYQIKEALKISAIHAEESIWRHVPGNGLPGAQIDMLFDRADQTVNICEMKFSVSEFTITKGYADELKQKLQVFKDKTKTKKSLLLAMITTYGVTRNIHYTGLVQNDISVDALFEK
jgi:AAA+ ATPase superfamily predicted ATPase